MSSTAHSTTTDREKQPGPTKESSLRSALTFPEGGSSGWLTVLGSFECFRPSLRRVLSAQQCPHFILDIWCSLSFGVLEDHYTRIFLNNSSASDVSWIGSMQLFLDFSIGLPAGFSCYQFANQTSTIKYFSLKESVWESDGFAILLVIGNLLTKPRLPTKKQRAPEDNAVLKLILKISLTDFYLQLYAVLHGVDKGVAFYTITVLNAATILGRTISVLSGGPLCPSVAIPMTTVSGGLVFAMLNLQTVGSLFVFAAFYGFFSGAFMSLLSAMMASFAFSVNEIGSRIGIAMFLLSVPLLTGAPITGAFLHPPHYTWWRGVTFSGVVQLSGVSLIALSRRMVARRKGTWRCWRQIPELARSVMSLSMPEPEGELEPLQQYAAYPFTSDDEYQGRFANSLLKNGLASILAGGALDNDPPEEIREEILRRTRVFYFNRVTGHAITMDEAREFEHAQRVADAPPLPGVPATTNDEEPVVLSFAQLQALIETGREDQIPNNKTIPDDLN
ncbi:hypothetical protein B0H16DRAFT_1699893, partial [Mycena metata]